MRNARNGILHVTMNNVQSRSQCGSTNLVERHTSITHRNDVVHANVVRRRNREPIYPLSAINYHEQIGIPNLELSPTKTCSYCQARLFHKESSQICCLDRKILLPHFPIPEEFLSLYTDQTPDGLYFRQKIRPLNHLFAFTSMGIRLDNSLENAQHGVYTFRAQGAIYHKIGGFLPSIAEHRPRFLQMYIYDTDHELDHRINENNTLRHDIVGKIKDILDRCNPFVHNFRSLAQREDIQHCALCICEQPSERSQYCLPTTSQVDAVVIGGEKVANLNPRDILFQSTLGHLMNVMDTAGYYDPMQYPLLLPYGSYGWSINSRDNTGRTIPCRDFYAYIFLIRANVVSIFLLAERLFQQYVVDNFVKNEANKLRWIRDNQDSIRAKLYDGLQDCLDAGEHNAINAGKKTILPSSFVGSPRDMNQRYQDAMALVQHFGKPDLFLTMTCTPSWKEIIDELYAGQKAQDRPDLITRIFHANFEEFKIDVVDKGALGKVVAYVYVVEFQKRGLPHVHTFIILDENDKPRSSDDYDKIGRAEIPYKNEEPQLYDAVLKHMIHKTCGNGHRSLACIENGDCKRKFPIH